MPPATGLRSSAAACRTVSMIESMLGANPAVVTLPIGSEDNFQGIIDLVAMKAVTWTGEVRCFPLHCAILPRLLQSSTNG